MRDEGFEIGRIPIVEVEAKNKKEAKRKVVALTSHMKKILDRLDEMARVREAATPGPWTWGFGNEDHFIVVEDKPDHTKPIIVEITTGTMNNQKNNLDFIAASRTEHELLEEALRISLKYIQTQKERDVRNYDAYDAETEIQALFDKS